MYVEGIVTELMKSMLEQKKISAYNVLDHLTHEDCSSLLHYVIDQGVVTPLDYKNFLESKYEDEISEALIGLHMDLCPYGDYINLSLDIEFPGTKIPTISKSLPAGERIDSRASMLEKKLSSLLENKIIEAFEKLNKDMPTPIFGKNFCLTLTIDGHDVFEVKYIYTMDEIIKNRLRFNNYPLYMDL